MYAEVKIKVFNKTTKKFSEPTEYNTCWVYGQLRGLQAYQEIVYEIRIEEPEPKQTEDSNRSDRRDK